MITQAKRLKSDLINVVLYLRMSSDKQDTSIDDQRAELLAYAAKHGYTILREYMDEATSGWKSGRQRKGFTHLIADASLGEFQAVLVWDQSRFSRFEPMEANFYWHQLKVAGVRIETVKEGRLDLDSLGGWLSASVQQHAKAEYCKSLAKDVARGLRRGRSEGKWLARAPYGYRVESYKLVEDGEKANIVRRIFRMRAEGAGYLQIARALNNDKIAPVKSIHWTSRQVSHMLRRRTYLGDSVYGQEPKGKFATVFDELTVMEGTHAGIIDRKTWDAVQKFNATRAIRRGNDGGEGAPLAGLLFCGDCGAPLYAWKNRNLYVCSNYATMGQCKYNWVHMHVMLAVIAERIKQDVLLGSVEKLTAAIEKVLAKRKPIPKVDLGAVRKAIADIDRKLGQAAERIMDVDASLVKAMESKMLDLQAQREALEAKLQVTPAAKRPPSAKALAEGIWTIDEVLRGGSPAAIRHALSQLVQRIEIEFIPGRGVQGKRLKNKAIGGHICINSDMLPKLHVPVCTSRIRLKATDFAAAAV